MQWSSWIPARYTRQMVWQVVLRWISSSAGGNTLTKAHHMILICKSKPAFPFYDLVQFPELQVLRIDTAASAISLPIVDFINILPLFACTIAAPNLEKPILIAQEPSWRNPIGLTPQWRLRLIIISLKEVLHRLLSIYVHVEPLCANSKSLVNRLNIICG